MSTQSPDTPILGIHHVTAIASDPQRNFDFYSGVLGLRLVKKTVNFDDPGAYHFYFGDGEGRPGTLLTFFPWPDARPGKPGAGQTSATTFAVPTEALGYWAERLAARGVDVDHARRDGDDVLTFTDPDGLSLELVERGDLGDWRPWDRGDVPAARAIHGIDSVTLAEADPASTATFLTDGLGFRSAGVEGDRSTFAAGVGEVGTRVDLVPVGSGFGRIAAGSVHHVAFRLADDDSQQAWQRYLSKSGVMVTPVKDRDYFHSIYFREPGGVLFELATDNPGFAIDEPVAELGNSLQLPDFLKPRREEIERRLPPLVTPSSAPKVAAGATS